MRRVAVVAIGAAVITVAVLAVVIIRAIPPGDPDAQSEARHACEAVVRVGQQFGDGTITMAQFHVAVVAQQDYAEDAYRHDSSAEPIWRAIFALNLATTGRTPGDFTTPYQALVRECG